MELTINTKKKTITMEAISYYDYDLQSHQDDQAKDVDSDKSSSLHFEYKSSYSKNQSKFWNHEEQKDYIHYHHKVLIDTLEFDLQLKDY